MQPLQRRHNKVRERRLQISTVASSWINFNPASLNPTLWLDASDLSTITESGGSVSQWNDKSVNGYTFTQGTAGSQPTTGTRTQNGLNVIDFDGGDSLLSSAAASTWTFLSNGDKFIVACVVARDVAGINGTIFSTRTGATGGGIEWRFLSVNVIDHTVSGVVANQPSVGTSTTARCFSLFSDILNATAANRSIIFREQENGFQGNGTSGTPSTADPPSSLNVGNRSASAVPLDGFIAEIIIVKEAGATLNNLFVLRNYLIRKWGVSF